MIQMIQGSHEMGPEIERELFIDNTPVENLCHQRGYFKIFVCGGEHMYVHYYMDHVIQNVDLKLIGRALQEVTVYESFMEYESERIRMLSRVKPTEQEGLNLN
jgi:hypothetical protein